jgi:hypothetical protein
VDTFGPSEILVIVSVFVATICLVSYWIRPSLASIAAASFGTVFLHVSASSVIFSDQFVAFCLFATSLMVIVSVILLKLSKVSHPESFLGGVFKNVYLLSVWVGISILICLLLVAALLNTQVDVSRIEFGVLYASLSIALLSGMLMVKAEGSLATTALVASASFVIAGPIVYMVVTLNPLLLVPLALFSIALSLFVGLNIHKITQAYWYRLAAGVCDWGMFDGGPVKVIIATGLAIVIMSLPVIYFTLR